MNRPAPKGFTLLELMTVMAIIIVLAAMILHGIGYAQRKAARDRAAAEIAAISVALESYKIDNGEYPDNSVTKGLLPITPGGTAAPPNDAYKSASGVLAFALCGDDVGAATGQRKYLDLPQSCFSADTVSVTVGGITAEVKYLVDPFGNAYGYSTAEVFNPTFDLWSYAGDPSPPPPGQVRWVGWITNW